jgi:hypothetical protein
MEIKKKSGLTPQRYIGLRVFFELHWVLPYHALNSEFGNFEALRSFENVCLKLYPEISQTHEFRMV